MLGGRGVSAGHPCIAHTLPRLLRYAAKRAVRIMPLGGSMLDETGFYAPSMAHNALPSRPWLGISAYLSIILQYLNRFAIRSRGSVLCPMAGRRFATFVPHVVAQSLTRVKSSNAFARVLRSTSSGVVPLISAIFFITYGMFDESFLVPR